MKKSEHPNPIWSAVYDLGGNAAFARILGNFTMQVDHRTVYIWKQKGFIPSKYRAGVRELIEHFRRVLTDPDGLEASVSVGVRHNQAHFANPELTRWVQSHGGITPVLKAFNKILALEKTEGDFTQTPRKYVHLHNWLKRGRVPLELRAAWIRLGCPESVLDADLVKEKRLTFKERQEQERRRLEGVDRKAYESALKLPYSTAASVAETSRRAAGQVNPLGDE